VEVVPSPKSQVQYVGLPVDVSVNWTFMGDLPFTGVPLKEAAGGGEDTALMVKVWAEEVPPPGIGLKTVTLAVPWVTMSEASIAAVSWPEETYVVVRSTPFHRTFDVVMKLLPVTVMVNAGPPAVAELGEMDVRVGTGLLAGLMVKVWAEDVPPPGVGLKTMTLVVPGAAMSEAGMAAVSWAEE